VPSLFRRKTADAETPPAEPAEPAGPRPKSYTPSKKELGVTTPKRQSAGRRVAEPAPSNRRAAYRQV
jgi:hypothetical protein